MANNYYENTVKLPAFGKAKSTDVDGDFDGVEAGFDMLPAPDTDAPTTKGFSEPYVNVTGTDESHATNIKDIRDGAFFVGTDNGSAQDVYAVNLTPTPAALTTGMIVMFKIPTGMSNTGACTLNVDSLAVVNIKSTDGGDPAANELYTGSYAWFQYDGTNFQLLFPSMSALTAPTETIPAASTPAYTGLRTNSSGTAYEIGQPVNYRNRVINPEGMIDQRNKGVAVTATDSFIVDRWKVSFSTDGALAISGQQSTGIGGYRNSIKVTATTGEADMTTADDYCMPVYYKFLGYDVADFVNGATVTISFPFESNAPSSTVFSVALLAGDKDFSYVTDFIYTTQGAEQLITKTIIIPADASQYISNTTDGVGLQLYIAAIGGSNRSTATLDSWTAKVTNRIVTSTSATNPSPLFNVSLT